MSQGTKISRSVIVYCTKYTGNDRGKIEVSKVRTCLDGSRISVDESKTYESMVNFSIMHMLLCVAIRCECGIAEKDVKDFLQTKLPADKEGYKDVPAVAGWETKAQGEILAKVMALWYELPEATKLAGDQALKEAGLVENFGFSTCKVFSNWFGEDLICCAAHIDETPWMLNSEKKFLEIVNRLGKGSLDRDHGQEANFKTVTSPGQIHQTIPNPVNIKVVEKKANPEEIRDCQKRVVCINWGNRLTLLAVTQLGGWLNTW